MDFASLLNNLSYCSVFNQKIDEDLSSKKLFWKNLIPEARPVFIARIFLNYHKKIVIALDSYESMINWKSRLIISGVPADKIVFLPSAMSALFDDSMPEKNMISERIGAIEKISRKEPCIILTTPSALLEKTLPKDEFLKYIKKITLQEECPPEKLADFLHQVGYESHDPVHMPGMYFKRGGLIDIYPIDAQYPVRVEFFGDTIDRIKYFDPTLQTTIKPCEEFCILPARETIYPAEMGHLEDLLSRSIDYESLSLTEHASELLEKKVKEDIIQINEKTYFDRLPMYHPFFYPSSRSVLDYLYPEDLLVLDDIHKLKKFANSQWSDLEQSLTARTERGEILSCHASDYIEDFHRILEHDSLIVVSHLDSLPTDLSYDDKLEEKEFEIQDIVAYQGQVELILESIKRWKEEGLQIIFATDQPHRIKKILEPLGLGTDIDLANREHLMKQNPIIVQGNLAGGMILPNEKLIIVTDLEIFGVSRLKINHKKNRNSLPVSTILDLRAGDYVVHIQFGIGKFMGLVKRSSGGVEKECLQIDYAHPDKLFVPIDQLDRIQKYLSPTEVEPKLYRITGGDWKQVVQKARENARLFARELIQLYSSRKQATRPSYGEDTPWQEEMESTFPWTETPSQYQAIEDVKRDMNTEFPMDRLICGDVGFGKTEVAIRAAFKAVMDYRQVVVLCPTTILSEQHFRNFKERLSGFNIEIGLLNRFTTSANKKIIEDGIVSGDVSIVVGTHALLSKKLKFKNLGMVIIDEEQKFGVKQKEALKHLRTNIDVLSMSATPIPRTLSMALMDVRQMSLINDPPPGRLPVRTFVKTYNKGTVLEAVLRELSRGGQIYYVYNRVDGIYHVAERLRKMFPTTKIEVAHGQMNEKELEPVMVDFIRGDISILLCTTIIENGLDISSANTIIVEDADKLGLSQLYQLRGRVGRSDRQAYAYFLYNEADFLTEQGVARLRSLQQFSSLGSGYSLAYRDLQIRGAGNMLGAKQHGTMASVGYELYTELINQEVKVLKNVADFGNTDVDISDPLEGLEPLPIIDLPISGYIPKEYITDDAQRLYYYKQIISSRNAECLDKVLEEIDDRYGKCGHELLLLFEVMRMRLICKEIGITKISESGNRLRVNFKVSEVPTNWVVRKLQQKNRFALLTKEALIWPLKEDALKDCKVFISSIKQILNEELEIGLSRELS